MKRFMAYRSFWKEAEMTGIFGEMGVNTVAFISSNCMNSLGEPYCDYPPIWIGPETYDFAPLDQQINDLKQANPKAKLICIIDLNTPQWWVRYFMYRSGVERSADSLTELGRVASNPKWRKDTGDYLEAFLDHVESNYSDTICAYVLSCGTTSEWFDVSQGTESHSKTAAFQNWSNDSSIDIPPQSKRENITHEFLRDPQQDKEAIDYWRFCNYQIGETILFYSRIVQEKIIHRVPLGIFFGYIMELTDLASRAHLDYENVYSSPDLDFFIAPGPYGARDMGSNGGFMVPIGTLNQKGKIFLQEIDHRTYTANRFPAQAKGFTGYPKYWENQNDSIAGLQREFSLAFIEGTALWWFDMWSGWYADESIRDEIAKMAEIWQKFSQMPCRSTAEIAVFLDPESVYYMDPNNKMYKETLSDLRFVLGKVGAPYQVYSVNDIAELNLDQFKLVIFPNLYVIDNEKRILLQKACCSNRSILWFYGPGIISDGKYGETNVATFAGVDFKTTGITTTQMQSWQSVYSYSPDLSHMELRQIAQDAGVHIYGEEGDPVFGNSKFLAYHSAVSGSKTIRLPKTYAKVIDLLNEERIVAENTNSFSIDMNAPATKLFQLI